MAQQSPTRQLILEAVIRCIEKDGLERVTTRRIAEEAGTNIASINYHFRSKDELITETLSVTINHMLEDVMQSLADTRTPFEATLRKVFRYLIEGSWRFPGISRAHLTQAVITGRRDSVGARAMIKVFNGLVERAAEAYPRKGKTLLRTRLAQVMYAILFVLLTPDFFGLSKGKARTGTARARELADSCVELFLSGIHARA